MADRRHHKRGHENREKRDEDHSRSGHERGRRDRESPVRRERRRERSRSPNERHSRRGEDERTYRRERRDEREHREGRGHRQAESTAASSSRGDHRGHSPHKPWIKSKDQKNAESAAKKLEPDFGVSGKLAAETNTLNGVLIKYSEPPEARVPKTRWRFYEFKGDDFQNTLHLHRQSAYLIGRDRKIVDFPIDHPSCSKQHAVLQYRLVDYEKEDGRKGKKVKPYIIDLESTNGTHVNGDRIDNRRFVELKEKDVVKFGFSTREYVLLHENSKGSEDDAASPDPTTPTPTS